MATQLNTRTLYNLKHSLRGYELVSLLKGLGRLLVADSGQRAQCL